jgi:hypothetical protein
MNVTIRCIAPHHWTGTFIGEDGKPKTRHGDTWAAVGRKLARVKRRRERVL